MEIVEPLHCPFGGDGYTKHYHLYLTCLPASMRSENQIIASNYIKSLSLRLSQFTASFPFLLSFI